MFVLRLAHVDVVAALVGAVLFLVFGLPTSHPDDPTQLTSMATPTSEPESCPDDPAQLTARMLPELAEMTPEQRETLRIEWSDDDNERVAVWNHHRDHIIFAVMRETPLGCRSSDERRALLLHGPPPRPPTPTPTPR